MTATDAFIRQGDLALYVPNPETATGLTYSHLIAPGSAIVGTRHDQEVLIDYEGNTNNASNIKDFEDKIQHAAGRHITRYPTIARAMLKSDDLIRVGTARYEDDWRRWIVTDIENARSLRAWLGDEPLPLIGGDETKRQWSRKQIEDYMRRKLSGL